MWIEPAKKSDVSLAGIIIVITQFLNQTISYDKLSKDITQLKEEFLTAQIEQSSQFGKKEDLALLGNKLDFLSTKLDSLETEIRELKKTVKNNLASYDLDYSCQIENPINQDRTLYVSTERRPLVGMEVN